MPGAKHGLDTWAWARGGREPPRNWAPRHITGLSSDTPLTPPGIGNGTLHPDLFSVPRVLLRLLLGNCLPRVVVVLSWIACFMLSSSAASFVCSRPTFGTGRLEYCQPRLLSSRASCSAPSAPYSPAALELPLLCLGLFGRPYTYIGLAQRASPPQILQLFPA